MFCPFVHKGKKYEVSDASAQQPSNVRFPDGTILLVEAWIETTDLKPMFSGHSTLEQIQSLPTFDAFDVLDD